MTVTLSVTELVLGTREWENASHVPENSFHLEQPSSSHGSRDSELQKFIEQQANANTSKKTQSDMRVWERFCQQKGETRKMENIPVEQLDQLLGYFFKDITKKDGQPYEPDSLTSFHRSFNRYLSHKGTKLDLISDRAFAQSRATLAARRKQLRTIGKQII